VTKKPTKGRDVGWAVADGETKPIRQVLKDRATAHAKQDKVTRLDAFKERAFMQAMCASCLCCWPLVVARTESQHDAWCPAHGLWLSMQATR
jgi:hypothetical protein